MNKLVFSLGIIAVCLCLIEDAWAAPTIIHISKDSGCTLENWKKFKEQFNKDYSSSSMDPYHMLTFCENLLKIKEHNAAYRRGEKTYEMGVNENTDLNDLEIIMNRE